MVNEVSSVAYLVSVFLVNVHHISSRNFFGLCLLELCFDTQMHFCR